MGDRTSFVGALAASAFSASFAEACTIPIDTAKVRLQLQGAAAKGGASSHNARQSQVCRDLGALDDVVHKAAGLDACVQALRTRLEHVVQRAVCHAVGNTHAGHQAFGGERCFPPT